MSDNLIKKFDPRMFQFPISSALYHAIALENKVVSSYTFYRDVFVRLVGNNKNEFILHLSLMTYWSDFETSAVIN